MKLPLMLENQVYFRQIFEFYNFYLFNISYILLKQILDNILFLIVFY